MKPRTRNFALIAVSALLSITSPHAMAQSGNFIVAQHGKPVGTATATFTANASGYDTTTVVKVAMPGLNYNLSKTEKLTSTNKIRQVQLSATVNNSAVNLTAAPDAGQILLSVSANGRSTTARFAMHPGAVFFPDFDPGAFDTLLALAVKQNNRGLGPSFPSRLAPRLAPSYPSCLPPMPTSTVPWTESRSPCTTWKRPSGAPNPRSSPARRTNSSRPSCHSKASRWCAKASSSLRPPKPEPHPKLRKPRPQRLQHPSSNRLWSVIVSEALSSGVEQSASGPVGSGFDSLPIFVFAVALRAPSFPLFSAERVGHQ